MLGGKALISVEVIALKNTVLAGNMPTQYIKQKSAAYNGQRLFCCLYTKLVLRFLVTLRAVRFYGEGRFAVMASTTGFTLGHVSHSHPLATTVWKILGVAVTAFVDRCVKVMAEIADNRTPAALEDQVGRLIADVAFIAITGSSKSGLAIMADAT